MREVRHSALVNQPPARLYQLINDVERYPEFLPWCTHARVVERSEKQIIATLGVRQGPLQGEFTTRNELEPERRIRLHLVNGPFKSLEGEWLLTPVGEGGCKVELSMRFAFKNPLTAFAFERSFAATAASLLDAFVAQAR